MKCPHCGGEVSLESRKMALNIDHVTFSTLNKIMDLEGVTRTDLVNKAIGMYADEPLEASGRQYYQVSFNLTEENWERLHEVSTREQKTVRVVLRGILKVVLGQQIEEVL